ncbi:MAG: chemotaxis protein CheW [Oleibacter sp.]|nr:chemotaxis protein CheW [Thalassolituus sp.]
MVEKKTSVKPLGENSSSDIDVLQTYFNQLLDAVPDLDSDSGSDSGSDSQSTAELRISSAPNEVIDQQFIKDPGEMTTEVDAESIDQTLSLSPTDTAAPEISDWRQEKKIQCLLFTVAGLKLAIPLSLLGGVSLVDPNDVRPLFGQIAWSLGVYTDKKQTLRVVDTARLMMPERGVDLSQTGFSHLIQLNQSTWALACDSVTETLNLTQESIKWRARDGARPWLAGTVISEMCALLDVDKLIQLAEASRHSKNL